MFKVQWQGAIARHHRSGTLPTGPMQDPDWFQREADIDPASGFQVHFQFLTWPSPS